MLDGASLAVANPVAAVERLHPAHLREGEGTGEGEGAGEGAAAVERLQPAPRRPLRG